MAIRTILQNGDPLLRKRARQVTDFNERLATLLDDMRDTLKEADGVGLAAPQVGVLRRVVVIYDGEKFIDLVNPTIVSYAGEQVGEEACLSVPGRAGIVARPNVVVVRAQDRNGETFEMRGEALIARAFCHEIDHLEGILYIDKMIRELDLSKEADA
nr:peptide deformylase [Maliibacterium massiliense]